ncbi:MAG: hypothetical protein HC892_12495 [Saprospiraceae bacterium]|nr:hypothetical protein [Saprospiraceae bacterium]
MKRQGLILISLLLIVASTSAQQIKLLHQTFEVKDSVQEIHLDIYGEVQIESWAGNVIMTETQVELREVSSGLLKHLVDKGRYQVLASNPDTTVVLVLTSQITKLDSLVVKKRNEQTNQVENMRLQEYIKVRLFLPDSFEIYQDNQMLWRRRPKQLEAIQSPQDTLQEKGSGK